MKKALEYALISYELDKDEVNVLSDCWLYNYMGKYEDALPFLLKAQELGRNDEGINTEIAVSLGRSGNVKEAIEKLKKAMCNLAYAKGSFLILCLLRLKRYASR